MAWFLEEAGTLFEFLTAVGIVVDVNALDWELMAVMAFALRFRSISHKICEGRREATKMRITEVTKKGSCSASSPKRKRKDTDTIKNLQRRKVIEKNHDEGRER